MSVIAVLLNCPMIKFLKYLMVCTHAWPQLGLQDRSLSFLAIAPGQLKFASCNILITKH